MAIGLLRGEVEHDVSSRTEHQEHKYLNGMDYGTGIMRSTNLIQISRLRVSALIAALKGCQRLRLYQGACQRTCQR